MISMLQKKTAQAIVNIFETSKALGDYGKVTLIPGDSGELTYGRSQTTLKSGNLYLLIKAYCEAPGAQFAAQMNPYLPQLQSMDSALNHDQNLRTLLRQAGDDPVMRSTQDAFFDRVYWEPAQRRANELGLVLPLSLAILYDGQLHGSLKRIIDATTARIGPPQAVGEKVWISEYVSQRHAWLKSFENHPEVPKRVLARTVYRMESFRAIISANNWDLSLPLRVRGVLISAELFDDSSDIPEPIVVSAAEPAPANQPLLKLTDPPLQDQPGFTVIEGLQRALRLFGSRIDAVGTYDAQTEDAVKQFQLERGLKVDGIVGPRTYDEIEIVLASRRPTSGWGTGRPGSGTGPRPTSGWGGGRPGSGWGGQTGRGNRF